MSFCHYPNFLIPIYLQHHVRLWLCKNTGIRKSEFVLKNQFLLKMMSYILLIKVIILTVLFDSVSFQFKFLLLSLPVSSFRALYTDFRVQDFINSLDKLDSSLVCHFTYLYMYFACLSVCLYKKTAERNRPIFFVEPHVTSGKVYRWSHFQKICF